MRGRLIIALVGVVALVLAVHDIPLAGYLERVERDRLVTQLERDAFIIAGRTEEALEEGVTDAQVAEIDGLIADYAFEQSVRVVVVDADAIAAFESGGDSGDDFSNRPEIAEALTGQPATGERESVTLGEDLFYVAVPVLTGDDTVGAVRLSAPERVVSDQVSRQVRGLFVVAGLSLLIAAVIAVALAITITRPLGRLRRTTTQLAGGDLSARVDDQSGPSEIRELASSFNTMAARVETLVDRQRAFAGDASHQMRTPLTALRLRLEQASAAVEGDSSAGVQIDQAIVETDRLRRMIEGLLVLTRAEDAAIGPERIELSAATADRASYWTPLAEERGVRIVVEGKPEVVVLAIPDAIEQIIDNLVDNALEVSPAGSVVTLRVDPDPAEVELHVIDEGPGMTEDDRQRALERFWRGSGSADGGSGLGLAIVNQLARAAGGRVELRDADSGGIDAVVTLRSP